MALINHVHGSSTSTQLVHENIIFMALTNYIHRCSTFTHTRVSLNPVDYSSSVFSLAKLQVNPNTKVVHKNKISPTGFMIDRLQHSNVFFHTHTSMFNLTNKIIQHSYDHFSRVMPYFLLYFMLAVCYSCIHALHAKLL